ncbi:YdcF family protein [Kurthia sibirica]|uniref:Vancomycin resistance protein n=1 Tax=Kurthia sibirica TaxID=202750 RepID=A0A2U3AKJ8_9BACL|nr:YdcF family protein [Kurthia sibirica]PWI25042.1 vancomycin resistance protein [Kurthia sibirica]GEK34206.1 hypothetical protein KSI01_17390 [Kurthia sibirica]
MRWLIKMILVLMIIFGGFWFGMGYLIDRGQKPVADGSAKYAIVLGAKIKANGVPSQALKNRLDAAYNYAKKYPQVQLILSGGQGADENESEAVAMRNYLLARGMDEQRLILEDQSTSTYENIKFSMAKMLEPQQKTTIISNDFHLARGKMIANYFGMDADVVSAKTPTTIAFKAGVRERLGLIAQKITLWK